MGTPSAVRTRLKALPFVLTLAALALPGTLIAQEGVVQGRVTDVQTLNPVVFGLVTVVDADGREVATALTNSEGRYRVAVPVGTYELTVSAIGFGTQVLGSVQVVAGSEATADRQLARQALELQPLVVSVGRTPEKAITAPAHVEVVTEEALRSRPTITPVDHLRSVPGVDVITQGLQSTSPVVRGFNNIFSGSLHTLTDNRIAGVPSLRVNVMNFVPTTDEDIERIEVVLGPGSALYGPNTADGVLHMITRSPLRSTGTSLSLMTGERGILSGTFRTSRAFTDNFGLKVSGEYFQGDEWRLVDGVEVAEAARYASNLPFWRAALMQAAGITQAEADTRIGRIGQRDFSINRWNGEVRADWAITENTTAVLTAGMTNAGSQIELTGLGAGQASDWRYSFYQARLTHDRWFAQIYMNQSDAGDTFLLRNGAPITDRSSIVVAQIQHGASLGTRYDFTYGTDFIWTNPQTEGTINGIYEDDDETVEVGVYAQAEAELTPTLDLVLAGRLDEHSALPDPVISPRAALVWEPTPGQAFRATVNRAYSTPSSLNQFLDLGTAVPIDRGPELGLLGYSVRVQGTGETGFSFEQLDGSYLMRSPFTPGNPAALVPATSAVAYWQAAVGAAATVAPAGTPLDDPTLLPYLLGLMPSSGEISGNFLVEDENGDQVPFDLSQLSIPDIEPIRESTITTLELGYKGLLSERFLLAGDLWFSRRHRFVTPLTIQTPLVTLDGVDIATYLVPRLVADRGLSVPQATADAAALAALFGAIPVGVISSADVNANSAQLLASYRNFSDDIDLWGADLSATVFLTDIWSVSATASLVNDDTFTADDGAQVVLNAPKTKGTLSVGYRDPVSGLTAEVRGRYSAEFPAESGVFAGTVDAYTLFDVNVSYRLPMFPSATVQLGVQNALDETYSSFPGVAPVGRLGILRVRYEF